MIIGEWVTFVICSSNWYEDDLVRAAHTGYLADKDNNAPVIFLDDPQRLGNQESDGAV